MVVTSGTSTVVAVAAPTKQSSSCAVVLFTRCSPLRANAGASKVYVVAPVAVVAVVVVAPVVMLLAV